MSRSLRSTAITAASSLLRTSPSAPHATRPKSPSAHPQKNVYRACRESAFSRSLQEQQIRLTSPPCRTPPGQSAHTRQTHPGTSRSAPVLMSSIFVSTRQQRFAYARLPDPHLTPLTMPFPRSLTTTVFNQRSTRRFETSLRRTVPKGQTFISCKAPSTTNPAYMGTPFDVRDTRGCKVVCENSAS